MCGSCCAQDSPNRRGVMSSKACGEPALLLSTSILHALRMAVRATLDDPIRAAAATPPSPAPSPARALLPCPAVCARRQSVHCVILSPVPEAWMPGTLLPPDDASDAAVLACDLTACALHAWRTVRPHALGVTSTER